MLGSLTGNPVENSTILVTGPMLLRAFLILDIEAITWTRTAMGGREIRTGAFLHNGEFRSWSMKAIKRIPLKIIYDDARSPQTLVTYGKWNIEGEFLITYSPTGRRAAHKIHPNVKVIIEKKDEGNALR